MLRRTIVVSAAALIVLSLVGLGIAQQRTTGQDRERERPAVGNQQDVAEKATGVRDKTAKGVAHRASEIQGMTVKNGQGEDLGTVTDIVIDIRPGQVKYAALSYGGLLGVGDKLFAVPWRAFEHRHDASNDEHTLVLNIDKETLEKTPGFNQSEWPNFADPKFADEVDKHYAKIRVQRDRGAGVDIEAGQGKVDVDVDVNRPRIERRDASSADTKNPIRRGSKIIGLTVKNSAGKDLGTVNDLVVDMDTGKVRYAALSYGGFLGLGDKLFAIPWGSFDSGYNASDETHYLVLAIDEATLRKAPGFDQDNWPNLADPKFGEDIDKYYQNAGDQSKAPARQPERN